jgi:glutamine---fructose-6-phosphate transaminase (isomerizing)
MRGVIGYVGRRGAKERLLHGLERLEYRGYDLAGICLIGCEGLESVRAVGKLENLKLKAAGIASRPTAGIGHTRWATHGRVTEENAHPLTAGEHQQIAIVLSGIVENHGEIKRALIADGERFCSETDAEVVAHLVKRGPAGDLVEAVGAAYARDWTIDWDLTPLPKLAARPALAGQRIAVEGARPRAATQRTGDTNGSKR